jgi:hypothetical protein
LREAGKVVDWFFDYFFTRSAWDVAPAMLSGKVSDAVSVSLPKPNHAKVVGGIEECNRLRIRNGFQTILCVGHNFLPELKKCAFRRWESVANLIPGSERFGDTARLASQWDEYVLETTPVTLRDFDHWSKTMAHCWAYWTSKRSEWPDLSRAACVCMCMPVSSAIVERAFSRVRKIFPANFIESNFDTFLRNHWNSTELLLVENPEMAQL